MSLLALALVITAAVTHASWNFLAKTTAHVRHFNWFYSVGSSLLFLPLALWTLAEHGLPFSALEITLLSGSAFVHLAYSESLQRGYRVGDLSVVYPVARGTGPLLAFIGAVLVLGERPSVLAALGAALVIGGVFMIAGGLSVRASGASRAGLIAGAATGGLIAVYTVIDGYSVGRLGLAPVLVDYCGNLLRSIALLSRVKGDTAQAWSEYRRYWRAALGVSILGPAGYILVLYAMKLAPVSHVAPARELSMMIGAYLGARVLKEGRARTRFFAAMLIVGGVIGLAIG